MKQKPANSSPIFSKLSRLSRILWFLCLTACAAGAATDDWHYSGVERVVAVSDVHGAYPAMVSTFQNAGVIDADLAWAGGATNLVITGDLLDRGPDSRQIMDLIMALEPQAVAAGGRVHQLVGNHEVMNLAGDVRYVSAREYAAFEDDEDPQERARWFEKYVADAGPSADPVALQEAFEKLAPPGFFGHRRAFRADGRYGQWLLEKPLMVVIDGTAFVHGGMPQYVSEVGLEGINGTLGDELRRYVESVNLLEDASILSPTVSFYDHPTVLQRATEAGAVDPRFADAVKIVIELNGSAIHSLDSPLWYRGTVGCTELIEGDVLDAAFERIGANRVVVGHTPTITRRVLQRMDGRVIEIDTGMLSAAYKGSGNALAIEDGELQVINQDGSISAPVEHPRRVGYRSDSLDANALADILRNGDIIERTEDESGRTLVKLDVNGTPLLAFFQANPRKKGFAPELAAYRLDQLLELDMVPVTVSREVEGKPGTLQFFPASVQSEQQRSASGRGSSAWCPLQAQWNTMYIFDALVENPGRDLSFMLYSPDNWQLMLMNNGRSFGTGKKRPAYLRDVPLDITTSWVSALESLSDEVLSEQLGDVLDKKRISALAKRRDGLLDDAANQ